MITIYEWRPIAFTFLAVAIIELLVIAALIVYGMRYYK